MNNEIKPMNISELIELLKKEIVLRIKYRFGILRAIQIIERNLQRLEARKPQVLKFVEHRGQWRPLSAKGESLCDYGLNYMPRIRAEKLASDLGFQAQFIVEEDK